VKVEPEKVFHIEMTAEDKFVLLWKQGSTTVDSIDVPRKDVVTQEGQAEVVRFPDLAAKVDSEWKAKGQHSNPTDHKLDQAILHTDNKTEFKYIVGVIDAVYQPHRDLQLGPQDRKSAGVQHHLRGELRRCGRHSQICQRIRAAPRRTPAPYPQIAGIVYDGGDRRIFDIEHLGGLSV
jgi:hypothetical protein